MAISFNTEFYLEQKLAQLQENGETGFESTADVAAAFEAAGLTAEAHYEQYGLVEGLNPNEDFDTNVYLNQKLAQLQADGEEFASVEDVVAAFKAAGLSPLEHYNQYGAAEALSPNAEFNVQAYLEDKLALLQSEAETAEEWADLTTEDLMASFQAAGLTPLDHFQQYGEEEGLAAKPLPTTSSALTEALNELSNAEEAVESFLLEDAASNELVEAYIEDNALDAEASADVRSSITQLRTDTIAELNNNQLGDVGGSVSAARSDAYNNAIIEEQRDVYEESLATAQENVSEVAGLDNAVNGVVSAEEAFNSAIDAQAATDLAVDGEIAKVDTLNGATVATITYSQPVDSAAVAALASGDVLVSASTGGDLIVVDEDDNVVINATAADYAGIDALYAAVQADLNAIVARDNAENSFESALAGVLAAENPEIELADNVVLTDSAATPVDLEDVLYRDSDGKVYAIEKGTATTANTLEDGDSVYEVISYSVDSLDGSSATVTIGSEVSNVTAADYTEVSAATNNTVTVDTNANDLDVSGYYNTTTDANNDGTANEVGYEAGFAADAPLAEALSVAQNELNAFEAAVEEYQTVKALSEELSGLDTAVTEAREAIENSEEDGGLGITILDLGDSVTSGDDLILFAEDEGTTTTISNFGAQGEDSIYFGGDFSLVALGDNNITDRVGDNSANEIFWEEDATGLTLYAEANSAAGFDRDGAAQEQMTTIKLAGVSSDDINFEGGYLTAGEVA